MNKKFFGIEIFENNLVSEDDIKKLPFYEFWNESALGSTYLVKDGKNYNVLSNEPCIDIEGMWGDTADDILEYIVGGDRLRDVITQVEVVVRTI